MNGDISEKVISHLNKIFAAFLVLVISPYIAGAFSPPLRHYFELAVAPGKIILLLLLLAIRGANRWIRLLFIVTLLLILFGAYREIVIISAHLRLNKLLYPVKDPFW